LKGEAVAKEGKDNAVLKIQVTVDDQQPKVMMMPTDYRIRSNDVYWQYDLQEGNHKVHLQLLNPSGDYELNVEEYISYK
jgi:hypothetical protein